MFFGFFLFFKVHTQSLSQVSPSLSPLIVHLFFNLSFGSLHLSYALCVCPSVCQSLFVILLLFFHPFLFQTVSFYPSLKFFSMSNDLHLMSSTSTLRNKSPSLSYIYLVQFLGLSVLILPIQAIQSLYQSLSYIASFTNVTDFQLPSLVPLTQVITYPGVIPGLPVPQSSSTKVTPCTISIPRVKESCMGHVRRSLRHS